MPARMRSTINDRSNSAMAPTIWNISLPEGVLKSQLSLRETKVTPRASSSAIAVTRCLSDLPKRSSFQTRIPSNRRWCAWAMRRFRL